MQISFNSTYSFINLRRLIFGLFALAYIATNVFIIARPASALVATCSQTLNGAGTPAPGTVIAPHLRVLKSIYQNGDCDTAISATARSTDGTIWGVDQGVFKPGLWKSSDDLASWQLVYQTNYVTVEQILPLASGYFLIATLDSSGNRHIQRSTNTSATAFAPSSLDLPPGAYLHDSRNWLQMPDGTIYISQYQGTEPMHIWKSTDDGQTWTVAYQDNVDEFHSIQIDPFVPGRIWLCTDLADSVNELYVGYTDNGGASWTWASHAKYPETRVLNLMFTADAVYWGPDYASATSDLYKYDRSTGMVTTLLHGLYGSWMNTHQYNGMLLQFNSVDPSPAVGDNYIHALTSDNGSSWSETKMPFRRIASSNNAYAFETHFTEPDSQGRFWSSFWNIDGTQFSNMNMLLQFDPTAVYNGPKASFTPSTAIPAPGQSVSFDGASSTTPNPSLTYNWDFGDGSTATGANTTHTYPNAGTYTARLQVTDAISNINETRQIITVSSGGQTGTAPLANTNAASGVTYNSATLNGSVNPNGYATNAHFEYGTTTIYGSSTSNQDMGSGTSNTPVSANLTGLAANTTYHYRMVATNQYGTTNGSDGSFTTPAAPTFPPSATVNPASNLTSSSATLNGSVNPNGFSTTANFEYGTTTSYGSTTAVQNMGNGTSPTALSANITGLNPNTTYHYRVSVTNQYGTVKSSDGSFTTQSALVFPPSVTTLSVTSITKSTAQLNGTVNPSGGATSYYFEYGTTTAYGSKTAIQSAGSGTSNVSVSAGLNKLSRLTAYHVRLVATNSAGTTFGQDVVFTTKK